MRNVALDAALAILGWAPSASATSIALSDLISPDASITAGDKLFTNFSFSAAGSGVPAPDPLRIAVTPITDGAPGLHFDTPDLMVVGDGNSVTLHIGFDALSLGDAIIDAELSFRGRAIAEDVGAISIGESLTSGGSPVGSLYVFVDPVYQKTRRTDHIEFAPVQSLHVSKDITLNAAFIQDFTQTFSKAPEPATWLTFGSGLADSSGSVDAGGTGLPVERNSARCGRADSGRRREHRRRGRSRRRSDTLDGSRRP